MHLFSSFCPTLSTFHWSWRRPWARTSPPSRTTFTILTRISCHTILTGRRRAVCVKMLTELRTVLVFHQWTLLLLSCYRQTTPGLLDLSLFFLSVSLRCLWSFIVLINDSSTGKHWTFQHAVFPINVSAAWKTSHEPWWTRILSPGNFRVLAGEIQLMIATFR